MSVSRVGTSDCRSLSHAPAARSARRTAGMCCGAGREDAPPRMSTCSCSPRLIGTSGTRKRAKKEHLADHVAVDLIQARQALVMGAIEHSMAIVMENSVTRVPSGRFRASRLQSGTSRRFLRSWCAGAWPAVRRRAGSARPAARRMPRSFIRSACRRGPRSTTRGSSTPVAMKSANDPRRHRISTHSGTWPSAGALATGRRAPALRRKRPGR